MATDTEVRIELDGLDVYVTAETEEPAPWGSIHQPVTKYRVRVESPEGRHETPAWGSINDREQGRLDHEGIGFMVLDELLSAAYDPDEFFRMATEGDGGRDRAVQILTLIETAEGMLPALERNADAIYR